jgi:Cof subfamily protein (haloacid dehalogenase superfamily)
MTEAIRLLVSDVDGTLVRHDKSLAEANVAAIGRLRGAGVLVSLISARPPSGMWDIIRRLDLPGPFGAFNGGTLFMADGTVTKARQLGADVLHQTLAAFSAAGVEAWVFAGGQWYAPGAGNPHVPREILSAGTEPTLVRDLSAIVGPVDKIVGVSDDHDGLARVEATLAAALSGRARVGRSQDYFLDVTAPAANKGDGVAAIAAAFGVDLAATWVIGDMNNDIAMFERAGRSTAMAQGPRAVRDAADDVTASNEDDGVAVAIGRFLAEKA